MQSKPSQEEIQGWVQHPVSKWLFSELEERMEDLVHDIAGGGTLKDSAHETNQQTAKVVGRIEGLNAVLLVLEEE